MFVTPATVSLILDSAVVILFFAWPGARGDEPSSIRQDIIATGQYETHVFDIVLFAALRMLVFLPSVFMFCRKQRVVAVFPAMWLSANACLVTAKGLAFFANRRQFDGQWLLLLLCLGSIICQLLCFKHLRSTAAVLEKKHVFLRAAFLSLTSPTGTGGGSFRDAGGLEGGQRGAGKGSSGSLVPRRTTRFSSDGDAHDVEMGHEYRDFLSDWNLKVEAMQSSWGQKLDSWVGRWEDMTKSKSDQLSPLHLLVQLFAHRDVYQDLEQAYLRDPSGFEFYLPQYVLFLLYASFVNSSRLEVFLLGKCQENLHLAHGLYWFLSAFCVQGAGVTPAGVNAIEQLLRDVVQRGEGPAAALSEGQGPGEWGGRLAARQDPKYLKLFTRVDEGRRCQPFSGTFQASPSFCETLCGVSREIKAYPREERTAELRRRLADVQDLYLPSKVIYAPVGNRRHRVYRIHAEESFAFSTKDRAPFLLTLEILDYDRPDKQDASRKPGLMGGWADKIRSLKSLPSFQRTFRLGMQEFTIKIGDDVNLAAIKNPPSPGGSTGSGTPAGGIGDAANQQGFFATPRPPHTSINGGGAPASYGSFADMALFNQPPPKPSTVSWTSNTSHMHGSRSSPSLSTPPGGRGRAGILKPPPGEGPAAPPPAKSESNLVSLHTLNDPQQWDSMGQWSAPMIGRRGSVDDSSLGPEGKGSGRSRRGRQGFAGANRRSRAYSDPPASLNMAAASPLSASSSEQAPSPRLTPRDMLSRGRGGAQRQQPENSSQSSGAFFIGGNEELTEQEPWSSRHRGGSSPSATPWAQSPERETLLRQRGSGPALSPHGDRHPSYGSASADPFASGTTQDGGGRPARDSMVSLGDLSFTDSLHDPDNPNYSPAHSRHHSPSPRRDADRDAPPTVIFKERWRQKEARIRKDSPVGHLRGWRLLPVIVKSGDDLRQEQIAAQFIRQLHRILQESAEPGQGWMRPYDIMATSPDCGIIEAVPDTVSLDALKRNDPQYTTLLDFFERHFGPQESEGFTQARLCFVRSLATYCIVCFLLQVKDRHNGNILLDHRGHIIHIDFGFMLANSPGGNFNFESAPFKLTSEFIALMDGPASQTFKLFREVCVDTFMTLRRQMQKVLLLVEMTAVGNGHLPCFAGRPDRVVDDLAKRFRPELNDPAAVQFVHNLIEESMHSWRTQWYDRYQRLCVGIR